MFALNTVRCVALRRVVVRHPAWTNLYSLVTICYRVAHCLYINITFRHNVLTLNNCTIIQGEPKLCIFQYIMSLQPFKILAATLSMVHGRGCNPHRCTTTFANVEITSLWRHNSETIRDRQKRIPHRRMKSSELSNGENRIALRQLLQNRNYVIHDVIIWVQDENCKKWLERILVFVRCTIWPQISTIRSKL